jgi:hypothetical protein
MNPQQKLALYSALMIAPLVLAGVLWLGMSVVTAERSAKFMSAFQTIHETKPPLSVSQVEQLMGQPLRIEQSETTDQTVKGMVYHYPTYPAGGDFQVVFVNGVVFNTALPATSKS